MSAGRKVFATVTAILAVGAAAAAATGVGFGHGGDPAADPAGPPSTATVTRQTLVDTQSETGDLGYGDSTTIAARVPGTVTWLPTAGRVVTRGQALYRLDDRPVPLLYGALPAYRTLAPGTKGADVKQFERNLWALGYRGFTVDDTYNGATAYAVGKWQHDLGVPKTGRVELGAVAYAAGPVRIGADVAAVGADLAPGGGVLTTTGLAHVVTVDLNVDDQRLAHVGAAVTVTMPSGDQVPGRITGTRTIIDPGDGSPGSDPTTKIEVTVAVTDSKALTGFDAATVSCAFTASEKPGVLTVPVAALLALAEGGYGVEVVDAGGATHIVAVQTGLYAGGRVEVSGDGLTEGATVGMPS